MGFKIHLKDLKPIFHCEAKYLASGVGVGQCPRSQNFALEIPTCWYILALPNAKICVPPTPNLKFGLGLFAPNASQWNIVCVGFPGVGSRVGHVHFIFFVSISFALGSVFPVEYGLEFIFSPCIFKLNNN